MVKVVFLVLLSVTYVWGLSLSQHGCPVSNQVQSCSPKCKDDSECFGQKCCPNVCNAKSCVQAASNSNTKEGYKNTASKTATGSYCGNVKCNSYEKCGLDPSTKRQKCIRS